MSSQSTLDAINIWSYLCSLRLKGKLDWDDGEIFRTVLNSARNEGFFFVKDSSGFPAGVLLLEYARDTNTAHVKLLAASSKSALCRIIEWGSLRFPGVCLSAKRRGRPLTLSQEQTIKYIKKLYVRRTR